MPASVAANASDITNKPTISLNQARPDRSMASSHLQPAPRMSYHMLKNRQLPCSRYAGSDGTRGWRKCFRYPVQPRLREHIADARTGRNNCRRGDERDAYRKCAQLRQMRAVDLSLSTEEPPRSVPRGPVHGRAQIARAGGRGEDGRHLPQAQVWRPSTWRCRPRLGPIPKLLAEATLDNAMLMLIDMVRAIWGLDAPPIA